jgi:hypothetical protein
MRMMLKILAPGVEHAQKTDFRTEMLGVGGYFQQSRGAGTEQEIVDDLLVLQSQPGKLVGERENDMHVADREQFLAALGQPFVAGIRLAFWAMPVTAGIERDGFMATSGTAIQVALSTRRWSHVNQDRFFAMKRLPYCRMISATSKGGWFIAFAACGSA